ncbi:MAG TPA: hypothetical protein VG537_06880 [Candidatus Kapabacteria bacterium]|jgi:hypothetical protein|nr:hypothetical protein [Candidatus Kapabacteria bacterium]
MKKITLLAVLSFVGLLVFGVASCVNPIGVGNGGGNGNGDTTVHRRGGDSLGDTLRLPPDSLHHHHHGGDSLSDTLRLPPDTLHHRGDDDSMWHHGGGMGDTNELPPDSGNGRLDSTFIDSLLHHH